MDIDYRIIDTGLTRQKDCDILNVLFGQLSDGYWENSTRMQHYWPYIKAEYTGGKVVLKVDTIIKDESHLSNYFVDMSDEKIKFWIATKIKEIIKNVEGHEWFRDNVCYSEYLDTRYEKCRKDTTVKDCYYVYEKLKGRNTDKYPIYKHMKIDESKLDWDNEIDEDFTMGVGAPLGADQGIPHSMDGCAVPMMRLGEPAPYGRKQQCCPGNPPPPPHRHRPIGFYPIGFLTQTTTSTVKRKKKKKKKKKSKKK